MSTVYLTERYQYNSAFKNDEAPCPSRTIVYKNACKSTCQYLMPLKRLNHPPHKPYGPFGPKGSTAPFIDGVYNHFNKNRKEEVSCKSIKELQGLPFTRR